MGHSFSAQDNGRRHEVALALEDFLAGNHLATRGARFGNGLRVALDRALVDERAHERARIDRVADPHLGVGVREFLLEVREPRAVHQDSSGRRTALSRSSYRAKHDGGHGEFQVR